MKCIISGGGTGGHIYPAIAIANEIKSREPEAEILFVGAQDKMEMQKVPMAGYEIKGLWISGIQRKLTIKNLMFPLKIITSLWKSYKIIQQFKPNVVVGTGGFASGSVLKVAQWMNIPTIIQEQNSYPGITNKLLSHKAKAVCVAYDGLEKYFQTKQIIKTGNPVRQDLFDIENKREEALKHYGLHSHKKTVVVLGGSLGSKRINQLIEKEIKYFEENDLQLIWQCGKIYYEEYKKYNDYPNVTVCDFVEKMDCLYSVAHIIISRAGASSVSELAIVGKPVIFIPSPNVAEDHQTKNAQNVVDNQAALMIKEKDLDAQFIDCLTKVLNNQNLANSLSFNIKKIALPNATKDIVNLIYNVIH